MGQLNDERNCVVLEIDRLGSSGINRHDRGSGKYRNSFLSPVNVNVTDAGWESS